MTEAILDAEDVARRLLAMLGACCPTGDELFAAVESMAAPASDESRAPLRAFCRTLQKSMAGGA